MSFDLGSFAVASKAGKLEDDSVGLDKLITKLAEINANYVMGLDATIDVTFLGDILVGGGTLTLGADVSLFRDGINILRTDDILHANNSLHVGGDGKLYDRANTNNYIELADTVNISTDTDISGDLSISGTVDGIDIATRDAILTTTNGWGNHASAGYGTSNLVLGTTSSTALAGNTIIPSGNGILDWTVNYVGADIHQDNVPWSSGPLAGSTTNGLCRVVAIVEEANLAPTNAENRRYPVEHDMNDRLGVNIPWTDTDTIYEHPDTSGNVHIPAGGSTGQLLRYASAGTAGWFDLTTISTAQASAITANTAKVTYDAASAVAANTAKISYATAASDAVALNTAKTTAHALIDSDTMSGASATNVASAESVKAYVDGKYNLVYMQLHGQGAQDSDDIWYFPKDTGGVEYYKWEDDSDAVASTATSFTLPRASQHKGIIVPYDCTLVGFIGASSASGNSQGAFSLWTYQPHWGEGSTGGTVATRSHYGESDLTISSEGGDSWSTTTSYSTRPGKVVAHGGSEEYVDAPVELTAGMGIMPAATDTVASGGSNTQRITMTIILKVPII